MKCYICGGALADHRYIGDHPGINGEWHPLEPPTAYEMSIIERAFTQTGSQRGNIDNHGTHAGYRRHMRHGDMPPCEPCKEAKRQFDRQWKEKRRQNAVQTA